MKRRFYHPVSGSRKAWFPNCSRSAMFDSASDIASASAPAICLASASRRFAPVPADVSATNPVKILWLDGLGMSLCAKRLERGRFIWPSPADGCVAISASQLGYMLDGIDWRNPQHTWRPAAAG